jgi:hypothetical protein
MTVKGEWAKWKAKKGDVRKRETHEMRGVREKRG